MTATAKPAAQPAKLAKEKKENDPMPLIEAFLLKHKDDFALTQTQGKVHCNVTGHDLPLRVADLEQHLKTKKFVSCKKKGRVQLDFDWDKYAPHIIQHKKDKKALFCQLTAARLNKNPTEIEKHMNGKRFKSAVRDFEEMVAKDLAGELSDLEGDEEEEDSMDELLAGDDDIDEEDEEAEEEEGPPAKKQKVDEAAAGGEEEGKKATPMKKKGAAAEGKKGAATETELKKKKKKKGKKQINSKKRRKQKGTKKK